MMNITFFKEISAISRASEELQEHSESCISADQGHLRRKVFKARRAVDGDLVREDNLRDIQGDLSYVF